MGKDLSADFPTKPRPESMPDSAKQGRPNPRKDFEENVLRNVSYASPGAWCSILHKIHCVCVSRYWTVQKFCSPFQTSICMCVPLELPKGLYACSTIRTQRDSAGSAKDTEVLASAWDRARASTTRSVLIPEWGLPGDCLTQHSWDCTGARAVAHAARQAQG